MSDVKPSSYASRSSGDSKPTEHLHVQVVRRQEAEKHRQSQGCQRGSNKKGRIDLRLLQQSLARFNPGNCDRVDPHGADNQGVDEITEYKSLNQFG